MKPGAYERTKSTAAAEAAMYPPTTPNALASVPWMTVMRCITPSRAATPAPRGPYMPTACTSSR